MAKWLFKPGSFTSTIIMSAEDLHTYKLWTIFLPLELLVAVINIEDKILGALSGLQIEEKEC